MSRCIGYAAGEEIDLRDAQTFQKKPAAEDQNVRQTATFEHGIKLRYGRSPYRPDNFSRNCSISLPAGSEKDTLDALHDLTMAYYDQLEEQSWTRGGPTPEDAPILRKGIWIEVAEKCKVLGGITIEWEDQRVSFAALLNGSMCAAPSADE